MAIADTSGSVSIRGATITSAVARAACSAQEPRLLGERPLVDPAGIRSESAPVETPDPGRRISDAADARRELFSILEDRQASPRHDTSPAEAGPEAAWPSLVDATFAADDLPSETESLAAFVQVQAKEAVRAEPHATGASQENSSGGPRRIRPSVG
jgi:hypothetical protein